jgi:hypothetical protein
MFAVESQASDAPKSIVILPRARLAILHNIKLHLGLKKTFLIHPVSRFLRKFLEFCVFAESVLNFFDSQPLLLPIWELKSQRVKNIVLTGD